MESITIIKHNFNQVESNCNDQNWSEVRKDSLTTDNSISTICKHPETEKPKM